MLTNTTTIFYFLIIYTKPFNLNSQGHKLYSKVLAIEPNRLL